MNYTIRYGTLFFFFLFSFQSFSQDSSIANRINYYENKIKTYLDKEKNLDPFYSVNKEGIKLFASPQNKLANKPEFYVSWKNLDSLKTYLKVCSADEALQLYKSGKLENGFSNYGYIKREAGGTNKNGFFYGYRIAIDAGHTAGDIKMGVIEKKFLKFKPDPQKGLKDTINIAEGVLTYATAVLLKNKLQAEGAEVFLTRPFNGSTAYGITFDEWLKLSYNSTVEAMAKAGKLSVERKKWLLTKADKSDKFWFVFKDMELKKRAELINDFKPDFTVIIHYNVDEKNTDWVQPGTKNYCMAFIGGAFMRRDLQSIEKRFEFLRMIVTDDIELSLNLSDDVVKSFQKKLAVKIAERKDATYLHKGCLATGRAGVFCRNLQLTRNIHGPLVYGETLYQDNLNECILLNKEEDKLKNERVNEAADAYYEGIKAYVENWKK